VQFLGDRDEVPQFAGLQRVHRPTIRR
jgi:hypothetical protein